MTPFMQDSCESYKSFPQKLCKIVTSLAQKTRSCKILVRFQNYKQLSRARITHIATSCAKFLQDLQESCTKTDWTFLGRQLQDFYWDLNLRALKSLVPERFLFAVDLYVYMQLAILQISAVQSRNGANSSGYAIRHNALCFCVPKLCWHNQRSPFHCQLFVFLPQFTSQPHRERNAAACMQVHQVHEIHFAQLMKNTLSSSGLSSND